MRLAGFKFARAQLSAQQPIVFDVIGRCELKVGPQRCQQQKTHDVPAEPDHQAAPQHQRDTRRLQNQVMARPDPKAAIGQAVFFQRPRAHEGPRQFAQGKPVNGLAHARRSRVCRRGDIPVMAAVVLDREMTVKSGRQDQFGQPAFQRCVFMPHFVAEVDAKPANTATNQHHRQEAMQGQILAADKPRTEDKGPPKQGHQGERDPTVIGVCFEGRDGLFRRIAPVFPDHPIQQRGDYIIKQRCQPQGKRLTGDQHQRRAETHGPWQCQRQQPGVTFSVAIRR